MSPKSSTTAAKGFAMIQLIRCHECIRRKVKCDRLGPSCGHCSSKSLVCDYAPKSATVRPKLNGSNSEYKTPLKKSSVLSQSANGTDFMQSFCEACKGHRKGCSREAPKCSNCVESNTDCIYPNDLAVRRSSRSDGVSAAAGKNINSKPKCITCNTKGTICDKNDPCMQCIHDNSINECIYVLKFNATKEEEEVAKPERRLLNSTITMKPTTNSKDVLAAMVKPLKHKKEGPACMNCRKHHRTCSRGNPCNLCVERKVGCVYPPERVKTMKKKKTTAKDEKKESSDDEAERNQESCQKHEGEEEEEEDEDEENVEIEAAGEEFQIDAMNDVVSNDNNQKKEKYEENSQCEKIGKKVSSGMGDGDDGDDGDDGEDDDDDDDDDDAVEQKESCEQYQSAKGTDADVNDEAEATQINKPASNIASTNSHPQNTTYKTQSMATVSSLDLLNNLEIPSPTVMNLDGSMAPLSVASKLSPSVPRNIKLKRVAPDPETEAYNARASKLPKLTIRPLDEQPQKVCWDVSAEKGEYLGPFFNPASYSANKLRLCLQRSGVDVLSTAKKGECIELFKEHIAPHADIWLEQLEACAENIES